MSQTSRWKAPSPTADADVLRSDQPRFHALGSRDAGNGDLHVPSSLHAARDARGKIDSACLPAEDVGAPADAAPGLAACFYVTLPAEDHQQRFAAGELALPRPLVGNPEEAELDVL